MSRGTQVAWIAVVLLALAGAVLAGFALAVPINQYAAIGIDGAWDCDGPAEVGLVAAGSMALSWAALLGGLTMRRRGRQRFGFVVALIVASHGLLLLGLPGWWSEVQRNDSPSSPCL